MPDDHENTRRDWRIPDELWECIEPLLRPANRTPWGVIGPRR